MPKFQTGHLVTCEKTIKILLCHSERTKRSILAELDDTHLLVKESDIEIIKDEIYKMQDRLTENPIEKINK
jgi:hypothetical protein